MTNQFSVRDLETVALLGEAPIFPELLSIIDGLGLSSIVVTSPAQKSLLGDLSNRDIRVVNELNADFEEWICQKCTPSKTLFASFGLEVDFFMTADRKRVR